jgi:hypothetical protein
MIPITFNRKKKIFLDRNLELGYIRKYCKIFSIGLNLNLNYNKELEIHTQ